LVAEHNERLERAIALLREPVALDAEVDRRIMSAVRDAPAPKRWTRPVWRGAQWLVRPRTVRVRPLAGLALAAAAAVVWITASGPTGRPAAPAGSVASTGTVVQFVIVAQDARVVSLVGDFNDWGGDVTPMTRASGNGVWSIAVPLAPGRYRYAFLVDGEVWVSDPTAPPAQDDEFGRPGSVVTVGET
jgi:hypothetical protein